MAKAPPGIDDLDWDSLNDDQLKEVMRQAKERRSARFNKKVEEFREYAREEGFEVTLTPIGQTRREEPREEPRRRRRPAEAKANRISGPAWSSRNFRTLITQASFGRGGA